MNLTQLTETQLTETQQAFDSVATDYDGPLGNNALVQRIRARTLAALSDAVPSSGRLLDLGCGTGLDAVALARQGHRVTAIDWSPAMVGRTRARAREAGLEQMLDIHRLGVQELDHLVATDFDAAYADLGSLNCVPSLQEAARLIAGHLRPGGALVASVIGRVCPWELGIFALRGQWGRARVRAAKAPVAVPMNGRTVWTSYYSPGEFRSTFEAAGFRLRSLRALALLVPPPYMVAFADRHRRSMVMLQAIEDRVAAWPGLRHWGDHFLIVMQRNG